ncbi:MAG: mitochondrial fission ELM1 family protein [Candidatus Omnitrophica bacterium]|nr:mitochondrial fission ELM1 family protein [Candidatus Omnitrophota bacterium]
MKILVLDDGIKGNLNQAQGVAQALPGGEIQIVPIRLRGLTYSLPGRKGRYKLASKIIALFCRCRLWKLAQRFLNFFLERPLPQLPEKNNVCVISAGSVLAPVNLTIARTYGWRSVILMVPSWLPLSLFDLAIIPYHDFCRMKQLGKNVLVTLGSPNSITPSVLQMYRQEFSQIVSVPPGSEIIGILLGGNDQNYRITVTWTKKLLAGLRTYAKGHRVSLLFTTSRRTPENVVQYLQKQLPRWQAVVYAEYPGHLPGKSYYWGILACSDILVVTEDSINMISESITAGKKVIVVGVERKSARKLIFDETFKKMAQRNHILYLSTVEPDRLSECLSACHKYNFKAMNEAEICAQRILPLFH